LIKPILVILPYNPGDVIMALQAVGELKSHWPKLSFHYLVSDECHSLVDASPVIDQVYVLPRRSLKSQASMGKFQAAFTELEAFIQNLTSIYFSLSLNFFQEDFGGVIQSLVQADRKVGLELGEQGQFKIESRTMQYLAAIPIAREKNGWHVIDLFIHAATHELVELLELVNLGNHKELLGNRTLPQNSGLRKFHDVLPKRSRPELAIHLQPGQYLVFHPGAAWIGKRWPESHWARLATLCLSQGITLVFTGSPEEKPVMDRIRTLISPTLGTKIIDAVGKTTLLEAAWLIGHARLTVTGDTVAMHIAAATQSPSLSLFGPSNPVETGPYGAGHIILQTFPLPLPNLDFEHAHQGLEALLPEMVSVFVLTESKPKEQLKLTTAEGTLLGPEFKVWQTEWNPYLNMQFLSDRHRNPHPSFFESAGLREILEARLQHADLELRESLNSEPFIDSTKLNASKISLQKALKAAVENPSQETLLSLEQSERVLATETQDSLIWESYRICINGMPLKQLKEYLQLRQARFHLALREEQHCKMTCKIGKD
jgi:ADP-heptose:LPS heptosyltransferase